MCNLNYISHLNVNLQEVLYWESRRCKSVLSGVRETKAKLPPVDAMKPTSAIQNLSSGTLNWVIKLNYLTALNDMSDGGTNDKSVVKLDIRLPREACVARPVRRSRVSVAPAIHGVVAVSSWSVRDRPSAFINVPRYLPLSMASHRCLSRTRRKIDAVLGAT